MFATRYFAPHFFAPRYFPPGVTIAIVEAGVRGRRRRYIRLEKLPEPAYVDAYIDTTIIEQFEREPEIIQEIVEEAVYQYEQTGEEDNVVLVMMMLDWL